MLLSVTVVYMSVKKPSSTSSNSKFLWILLIALMPFLPACSVLDIINTTAKIYRVDTASDLSFGQHPRDNFDIYLPRKTTAATTPVVVFFYGGSWNSGSKEDYQFVGRRLAAQGYIVAIPNYRLYPEVAYPEFLVDSAAAVAAIKDELTKPAYQLYRPSSQIVLMGHSAGAYNAAMLAMDDRWLGQHQLDRQTLIAGFVGLAGPYDLYPINVEDVKPVFFHPNYPPNSNPVDFLDGFTTPTLILAPESDHLVSIEKNSFRLAKELTDRGTTNRLVQVKGTDHVTMIGVMSPLLFFKGSVIEPINQFISNLDWLVGEGKSKMATANTP